MPGIPAARRSRARCSTCCHEARTSSEELAGDHPGVAGLLAEPAYMRLPLAGFLPLADRVRVELEDQLVGGVAELTERHPGRGRGQVLVGPGGVGVD